MNRELPADTTECSNRQSASRAFPWSILGALILFCLLWMWDFPQPMCDDLFYSGAGLNLASGGDLSNPLLARQHLPGHLFLVYPPVHSYALAGWLKITGISAATMTGFQILMYFIIAAATILYLRWQNAPRWLEWLVPLGVAGAFLPFGLRPEPLAATLTMAGFVLVEFSGKKRIPLFIGFLLMSLGLAAAPRTVFFGAALLLLAGYQHLKTVGEPGKITWRSISIAVAGIATAFLVFCIMLDFRLFEHLQAMRLHGHVYLGGNKWGLVGLFFTRYVGFSQWPVFPLYLGLLIVSFRTAWQPFKCIGFIIAGMIPLTALVSGLGNGVMWYVFLAVFALVATAWQMSLARSTKIAISSLVIAISLFANAKAFVNIVGILSGNITSAPSPKRAEILAVQTSSEHPVLVDEFVSRYVFDYRIPKGFIYWPFSAPFPLELAIDTTLLPDDIYLLGPLNVDRLNNLHLTDLPQPTWGLWKKRWSFYREPRKVFIIPVKTLNQAQTGTHPESADSPP